MNLNANNIDACLSFERASILKKRYPANNFLPIYKLQSLPELVDIKISTSEPNEMGAKKKAALDYFQYGNQCT